MLATSVPVLIVQLCRTKLDSLKGHKQACNSDTMTALLGHTTQPGLFVSLPGRLLAVALLG